VAEAQTLRSRLEDTSQHVQRLVRELRSEIDRIEGIEAPSTHHAH
jgi:hypothetical protein